jgi:crotonobetainyl-CoA:carnitine CoA-transferase CaiB-like acyl-CoA transferase
MAQQIVTGKAAQPMPVRISAWAIYEIFETADNQQVFVGVVSDSLWQRFCDAFELRELGASPDYKLNNQRVAAKDVLLPQVRAVFKRYAKADLIAKLEKTGLPFAPIGRPEDMFNDPHLLASGGLGAVTLPDGRSSKLPILPLEMNGHRPTQGGHLARVGEHTLELLRGLGLDGAEISSLSAAGVVAAAD